MLQEHGVRASLEVIPGGHHWIDGQLRVRLHARVDEMLRGRDGKVVSERYNNAGA